MTVPYSSAAHILFCFYNLLMAADNKERSSMSSVARKKQRKMRASNKAGHYFFFFPSGHSARLSYWRAHEPLDQWTAKIIKRTWLVHRSISGSFPLLSAHIWPRKNKKKIWRPVKRAYSYRLFLSPVCRSFSLSGRKRSRGNDRSGERISWT